MKKTLLSLSLVTLALVGKAQNCSELFISEYVEGAGNNKAFEVYNPTNATKNLSNYRIVRYSNGSSYTNPVDDIDSTDLTGTIAPYSVHILANGQTSGGASSPACSPVLQALAQQLDHAYGAPTYANGDDAIALVRINPYKIIDIFGVIEQRPNVAWSDVSPFLGTTGKWWTKDHSLQRKQTIKTGVSTNPALFDVKAVWDSLPKDNWSKLGAHACDCFVPINANVSSSSTSVCVTTTANISTTVTGGTGIFAYTWAPASEIVGSINNASIVARPTYTTASLVYTVTIADGEIVNTRTVSISSEACPTLTFASSVIAASNTVCITDSVMVAAFGSSGNSTNFTYQWSPSNEISGSTTNNVIFAKPTTSTTAVIYTVVVSDGIATPQTHTVSIQAIDCFVSVKEITKTVSFNVFPNPNNGNTISVFSDKTILEIKIVNSIGQIVYNQQNINNNNVVLNNLGLSRGIYSILLSNSNGSKSQKLIIQ